MGRSDGLGKSRTWAWPENLGLGLDTCLGFVQVLTMSERITVKSIFVNTVPQKVLGEALSVAAPYTSEVKKSGYPGSRMTARLVARVLIPKFGREKAAEILLASLEERHADEFDAPPAAAVVLAEIWPKRDDAAEPASKIAA